MTVTMTNAMPAGSEAATTRATREHGLNRDAQRDREDRWKVKGPPHILSSGWPDKRPSRSSALRAAEPVEAFGVLRSSTTLKRWTRFSTVRSQHGVDFRPFFCIFELVCALRSPQLEVCVCAFFEQPA